MYYIVTVENGVLQTQFYWAPTMAEVSKGVCHQVPVICVAIGSCLPNVPPSFTSMHTEKLSK